MQNSTETDKLIVTEESVICFASLYLDILYSYIWKTRFMPICTLLSCLIHMVNGNKWSSMVLWYLFSTLFMAYERENILNYLRAYNACFCQISWSKALQLLRNYAESVNVLFFYIYRWTICLFYWQLTIYQCINFGILTS